MGWFVLPLTVYQVSEYIDQSLPLKDVILSFMKKLARRSSGAHVISQTFVNVVKEIGAGVSDSNSGRFPGALSGTQIDETTLGNNPPDLESAKWQREARILADSLRVLDSALEHNSVPI